MNESQLRKGVLDLAVLSILARGESYGYELTQDLMAAGFDQLGDATIYGTLRRMEQAGWVTSRLVPSSDGPARKYHSLTRAGRASLSDGMERWTELVASLAALMEERR
ncbi:MAG: PadR family transcriptional regulator [Actinobacteria bacterium]|nr:PadR family transcriptional regulator [Actinomycetota bacterium]